MNRYALQNTSPAHRLDTVKVTLTLAVGDSPGLEITSMHGESATSLGLLWSVTPNLWCARDDVPDFIRWTLDHLEDQLKVLCERRPQDPRRAHWAIHHDGGLDQMQRSLFEDQ